MLLSKLYNRKKSMSEQNRTAKDKYLKQNRLCLLKFKRRLQNNFEKCGGQRIEEQRLKEASIYLNAFNQNLRVGRGRAEKEKGGY